MSHINYYEPNLNHPNHVSDPISSLPSWSTQFSSNFLNKDKTDPFKEQVGGDHYKTMKIQPIEYILANDLGFCEANIVKYISRYKQKNGVQDVKKVIHYAEMLLAHLEEQANGLT